MAAVLVGLANLAALSLWFGDPAAMREDTSWVVSVAPALVAVIAGLATSEVALRAFELPGRTFSQRYRIAVISVCLGGAMMGAPLSMQFAIDGTLGAEPSLAPYADPTVLLGALLSVLPVGVVGATFGLVIGLAEGLVLGCPLAQPWRSFGALRGVRPRRAPSALTALARVPLGCEVPRPQPSRTYGE
jgi:hypothetical protein